MPKPRKTKVIDVDAAGNFQINTTVHGTNHSPTRTLIGHPWIQVAADFVQIGCLIVSTNALNKIAELQKQHPNEKHTHQTGDYGRPEDL